MGTLARLPSGMNITGKKQGERVGALFLCFWGNGLMVLYADAGLISEIIGVSKHRS
ncbi:hypothetical protein [Paenibacillus xylanilyticus]|uniref:hypothetical protein n=1 Tax=Paenibacillus xylanilyticus TaxID=248903 RepID=UPI00399F63F9